jgi:hypothetical protein
MNKIKRVKRLFDIKRIPKLFSGYMSFSLYKSNLKDFQYLIKNVSFMEEKQDKEFQRINKIKTNRRRKIYGFLLLLILLYNHKFLEGLVSDFITKIKINALVGVDERYEKLFLEMIDNEDGIDENTFLEIIGVPIFENIDNMFFYDHKKKLFQFSSKNVRKSVKNFYSSKFININQI